MKQLTVKSSSYNLPMFLPDATCGVVRHLDPNDLRQAGIRGLVVNSFHLLANPGIDVLEHLGGIKNLMSYKGLVVSDSGGWQIFSLLQRNQGLGKLTEDGVYFKQENGTTIFLSPEKSIEIQFKIKADIMVCLDAFTDPTADESQIKASVLTTIAWAKRCKSRYLELLTEHNLTSEMRPLLFAAVQGGWSRDQRRICAEALCELGFDGYGFGGYLVSPQTQALDLDMLGYLATLLPTESVKFALGTGKPFEIASLIDLGWDIFDCTLPTRDARHGRLYTLAKAPETLEDLKSQKTYAYVAIEKASYKTDQAPISALCQCYTCTNFSRAYLHQLFKLKDGLAYRLAEIHNLTVFEYVARRAGELKVG